MIERFIAPKGGKEEINIDFTLNPRSLDEFVGQKKIKENLRVFISAAKKRKEPLDHLLLYSPPGLGKKTLANIIAREMGVNMKSTSGPVLEKAGDLANILTNLSYGDILFIDEIHRLNRIVEESLYPVLEDFKFDIMIGQGPSAKSVKLDIPRFTLIGATTHEGLLTSPLKDRFGISAYIDFYTVEDLNEILARSAKILNISAEPNGIRLIAKRSSGTPRIANRLLKRIKDFADIRSDGVITETVAEEGLKAMGIDPVSLDYRVIENKKGSIKYNCPTCGKSCTGFFRLRTHLMGNPPGHNLSQDEADKEIVKIEANGNNQNREIILNGGKGILPPQPKQELIPQAANRTVISTEGESLIAGKYKLLREIGRGGMGIVYETLNKEIGKKVTIKKMKEELAINLREKKRFMEEAKRVADLHHPNIVDIYDMFEEGGNVYLVFEYVDGETVDNILNHKIRYGLEETKRVILAVCSALEYAHNKRIIHRDIKPSNIMETKERYVKVMDFGIARKAKDTLSRLTGKDTSGTMAYMAPEQEMGSYDAISDIFSVGVTFYEMLTGQLPFPGPNFLAQKREMVFRLPSEIIPALPKQVDELITKCLQADKEKRYQSIEELAEKLKTLK